MNGSWSEPESGSRRLSENGTAAMAAEAAQQALADAEISAEELDLVIAATSTPDYAFPGVACQVQAAIEPIGRSASISRQPAADSFMR